MCLVVDLSGRFWSFSSMVVLQTFVIFGALVRKSEIREASFLLHHLDRSPAPHFTCLIVFLLIK